MIQLFNLKFFSKKQEEKGQKKSFINKFLTHIARPFSLAKRLEHINNRGKKNR